MPPYCFFKSALADSTNDNLRNAAQKIVQELCCLPLAVDQAGAAVASGLCDIEEYLMIYHKHHKKLLDDPTFKGALNYGRAVYGTWDVSFSALKARVSKEPD